MSLEADKSFVIDASVAVKWFVQSNERNADRALAILAALLADQVKLHAPSVLPYEVAIALLRKWREGHRGRERSKLVEAFAAFLELPIDYVADFTPSSRGGELLGALKLAVDAQGKSYNDFRYIVLAESLGCRWLTDDTRAEGRGPGAVMLPLSQWALPATS